MINTPVKTEVVSVRVPKAVKDALIRKAQADRREVSDFLRLLLEDVANA